MRAQAPRESFGPHPPVVGFGTGGSGTRAVAAILRDAGLYIGPKLNKANDARVLKPFLRRWPEAYLERSRWIEASLGDASSELPPPDPAMVEDFLAAVELQREGIPRPDYRWAWKAPRTIYVLPLLHLTFPEARTIQLIRDGRDMAYSRNQNQLEAYGKLLVADMADAPDPVRSIALWSRVNLAALRYARRWMEGQHLVIRYESLCADPRGQTARLLAHVGVEATDDRLQAAAELIEISSSAGIWRERSATERAGLERAGRGGLEEFGYL